MQTGVSSDSRGHACGAAAVAPSQFSILIGASVKLVVRTHLPRRRLRWGGSSRRWQEASPGRSFCSETADPASKQAEAVGSVNHSFTAPLLGMQKAGGAAPAAFFFFLTGQIISTPLGVSAHVVVNVKQHLPDSHRQRRRVRESPRVQRDTQDIC